jgi:NTP pyrophosphatase (non-canonical NTP hydrolase)
MTDNLNAAFEEVEAFNDATLPTWRRNNLIWRTNALAGEVGELCNAAKKVDPSYMTHKPPTTAAELEDEVVDVFRVLVEVCEVLGLGPEDLAQKTTAKLKLVEARLKAAGRI